MSVARRGESGAASASSYWRLSQRRIQSSCWAAAATRRRWAAAARANRDSAVSSGPIITSAAKPPIAATTRTRAIPMANISYNNIGSPPPLVVGTKPLAYFLKFRFQRENAKRSWGHLLTADPAPSLTHRRSPLVIRWSAGSNDQCEQFNDAYSDHQHSKCYRVVIEPMRLLYIRRLYIHRRPPSVPRFELLDECSDMRGHRRR